MRGRETRIVSGKLVKQVVNDRKSAQANVFNLIVLSCNNNSINIRKIFVSSPLIT